MAEDGFILFETTSIKRYPAFRAVGEDGPRLRMLSLYPRPLDVVRAAPQLAPLFE